MTPEQFLSIAEIKRVCGISGDDLDAQLGVYRDAAIGVIESRTSRNITDRAALAVLSPDAPGSGKPPIEFSVFDALPITATTEVSYRTRRDEPGFDRDGTLSIPAAHWEVRPDRVRVYNGRVVAGNAPPVVDPWPERDETILFQTTLPVGIPAGKAPAEFKAAGLMLVRELQEGSALDALDPHNIVEVVLKDHITAGISAATERLLTAEGV